jgi:hypothetical protein
MESAFLLLVTVVWPDPPLFADWRKKIVKC